MNRRTFLKRLLLVTAVCTLNAKIAISGSGELPTVDEKAESLVAVFAKATHDHMVQMEALYRQMDRSFKPHARKEPSTVPSLQEVHDRMLAQVRLRGFNLDGFTSKPYEVNTSDFQSTATDIQTITSFVGRDGAEVSGSIEA